MSDELGSGASTRSMLIAGLLLGLGIGAGLVYALLGDKPVDPMATDGDPSATSGKVKAPSKLYDVTFERVAVPIYDVNGARPRFLGNYFLDVVIQTKSEGDQLKVKAAEPQLRHAFVDEISKANFMKDNNSLLLDNDRIRKAFEARSASVVGTGVVYAISVIRTVRLGT